MATIPVVGYNEDNDRMELIYGARTWDRACEIAEALSDQFPHAWIDVGIEGKTYPPTEVDEWFIAARRGRKAD